MRRLSACFLTVALAACSSTSRDLKPIPSSWLAVPEAARFDALSYSPDGMLTYRAPAKPTTPVHVEKTANGLRLMNGNLALTPDFVAIDSFDVTPDVKEVVFSAKRKDNFDVGLVSADGGAIHWVPEDPADEIAVQYSPQANKISYVVRTSSGDLVRTVHVATATGLVSDFPSGRVQALAWEPRGERYAVAWSSIEASARVESMKFGGEERRVVVAPAVQLAVTPDTIGGVPVLRPNDVRYNEKLPLVIWITDDPNRWNDARGALERNARVACAVVTSVPDAKFRAAATATRWIDASRMFIVGARGPAGVTSIEGSEAVPAGFYRESGGIVLVDPRSVESFAAGYIALQLKGFSPDHGSSLR